MLICFYILDETDSLLIIIFSPPPSPEPFNQFFLNPPQITVNNDAVQPKYDSDHESAVSSRRPSAIIAALRRPSQAIALSAAQAVMNQRRYFLG